MTASRAPTSRALVVWATLAITVAALSLGPSFAHVLEAEPRLRTWSAELWRETTVFNAQFWLFAPVGAALDIAAILCPALLAHMLRGDRPAARWAVAAAILYARALIAWFAWVRPANEILATWTPGPVPAEFARVRLRWETGHMAVAALKLCGFVALAVSLASMRRPA
jgi:hypothetical protein